MGKKALIPLSILIFAADALAQNAATAPFAGGVIRQAHCDVISYMQGSLGGMLMAATGILAMATAAFGNFKHAITAIAVGIAAFTMSEMSEFFFGQLCDANGNATGKDQARVFQQDLTAPDLDFEAEKNADPFDL